jgi:hypothetical protein
MLLLLRKTLQISVRVCVQCLVPYQYILIQKVNIALMSHPLALILVLATFSKFGQDYLGSMLLIDWTWLKDFSDTEIQLTIFSRT